MVVHGYRLTEQLRIGCPEYGPACFLLTEERRLSIGFLYPVDEIDFDFPVVWCGSAPQL